MNRKQKKQLEAAKKKLEKLRQLLSGARKQPDDPTVIPELERQVVEVEQEIHKIKAG